VVVASKRHGGASVLAHNLEDLMPQEDAPADDFESGNGTEDFEEVECDLAELLNHYKFHPLNYFFPTDIILLGKTDEFHLYSFHSNELEQSFVLKVMNDEHLYEVEKLMCGKLEGTLATLKLVNAFTFEFPLEEKAQDK
jgi:hypothetical protein